VKPAVKFLGKTVQLAFAQQLIQASSGS